MPEGLLSFRTRFVVESSVRSQARDFHDNNMPGVSALLVAIEQLAICADFETKRYELLKMLAIWPVASEPPGIQSCQP